MSTEKTIYQWKRNPFERTGNEFAHLSSVQGDNDFAIAVTHLVKDGIEHTDPAFLDRVNRVLNLCDGNASISRAMLRQPEFNTSEIVSADIEWGSYPEEELSGITYKREKDILAQLQELSDFHEQFDLVTLVRAEFLFDIEATKARTRFVLENRSLIPFLLSEIVKPGGFVYLTQTAGTKDTSFLEIFESYGFADRIPDYLAFLFQRVRTERDTGVEPVSSPWKGDIEPLN